jgi:hypothetical protein
MKDLIQSTIDKVSKRKTSTNKFFLVLRYLRMKYHVQVDRKALLNRFKSIR